MKTIFYTILLTGLSWFGYYTIGAQLVINEYSCANRGHHADNFGSFPDWVELHNPSGAPVLVALGVGVVNNDQVAAPSVVLPRL